MDTLDVQAGFPSCPHEDESFFVLTQAFDGLDKAHPRNAGRPVCRSCLHVHRHRHSNVCMRLTERRGAAARPSSQPLYTFSHFPQVRSKVWAGGQAPAGGTRATSLRQGPRAHGQHRHSAPTPGSPRRDGQRCGQFSPGGSLGNGRSRRPATGLTSSLGPSTGKDHGSRENPPSRRGQRCPPRNVRNAACRRAPRGEGHKPVSPG